MLEWRKTRSLGGGGGGTSVRCCCLLVQGLFVCGGACGNGDDG